MNPTIKLLYITCILSFFSSFAFGQNETEPNSDFTAANLVTLTNNTATRNGTIGRADATISIVPNPVTDRLTVNYAGGTIQNLQITNVTGQRMLQKIVNDAQTEIDVSSLSNGLYLLTMQTDQGQQITKFVKN
jgi:hypothetical protein